jgi:hypothetical protein
MAYHDGQSRQTAEQTSQQQGQTTFQEPTQNLTSTENSGTIMNQQDQETKEQSNREDTAPRREYEKSGLYPANGKPFRLWALLGWLTALIVVLAAVSALLNFLVLGAA